jgi:predicted RNA-binding protein with RPS1 domain
LIPVKLLAIDDQGRLKLSRKTALVELDREKDKQRVEEKK